MTGANIIFASANLSRLWLMKTDVHFELKWAEQSCTMCKAGTRKKDLLAKLKNDVAIKSRQQCDQMAKLFLSTFCHFTTYKICPISRKNCKSRFKILPITKRKLENCQRLLNFCQSGESSPDLVTLVRKWVGHLVLLGWPINDVTSHLLGLLTTKVLLVHPDCNSRPWTT